MSETRTETQEKGKSRHNKKKSQTQRMTLGEIYHWPWEIDIELFTDDKSTVAFMSGQEREYYPEKPGHSRHGVEYSMNCAPGDVPNPSYFPSDDRLQKPISTKGYGIGGLSAPRWKVEKEEKEPAPTFKEDEDEDNQDTRKSSVLSNASVFATPKHRNIRNYADESEATRRHKRELRLMDFHPVRSPTQDECRQRRLAFGGSTRVPRFKGAQSSSPPGVGHYNVYNTTQCKKVPVLTTFGTGPIHIPDSIFTNCDYEKFDNCVECLKPLISTDYYRSIRRMSIPEDYFTTYSAHTETATRPPPLLASDTAPPPLITPSWMAVASTSKIPVVTTLKNSPPKYIALCRTCYCDIKLLGHDYWTPKRMEGKFMKTRHCVNIHEHNGLPSFVYKVPCKLIRKLRRKEALMNKNFLDGCNTMTKWD